MQNGEPSQQPSKQRRLHSATLRRNMRALCGKVETRKQTWPSSVVPTTPACTWWNRPEEYNSSVKLESTHPSRTSVKSDQVFFGVESVMRVNADSLLIRAAATSTSGTLNDLTTDLIMANNNNNNLALNEACRSITGCLRPTSVENVYPLAGITPPGVRRATTTRQ